MPPVAVSPLGRAVRRDPDVVSVRELLDEEPSEQQGHARAGARVLVEPERRELVGAVPPMLEAARVERRRRGEGRIEKVGLGNAEAHNPAARDAEARDVDRSHDASIDVLALCEPEGLQHRPGHRVAVSPSRRFLYPRLGAQTLGPLR